MDDILNQDEYYRYSRQLAVKGVGVAGQKKLKASCIAIVGVGGIGCPAALYAAAAGIGRLILIDPDHIAVSNLHRQILYQTSDLGQSKVSVAKARLTALNPHVHIEIHPCALKGSEAIALLESADIVIDGTDNYHSRYEINLACIQAKKPLISASVYSWSGQIGFFHPGNTPCYACAYPSAPTEDLIPNCQIAGTLGLVTGIIALQAVGEGLKYLLGMPVRHDQLMVYDALTAQLNHYPIRKRPNCPACVGQSAIYEDFMKYNPKTPPAVPTIDCLTLHALQSKSEPHVLVDVREPWERDICKIEGSLAIPLSQFELELARLNPNDHIIIHCRSGGRSACATQILQDHGYPKVHNLEGGILAWIDQIDPKQTKY